MSEEDYDEDEDEDEGGDEDERKKLDSFQLPLMLKR